MLCYEDTEALEAQSLVKEGLPDSSYTDTEI